MLDKAIITSASTKFFPSLINLIGSIKRNYPNHPKIFVYDIGLLDIFVEELRLIDNVEIVQMPKFCSHWRSCYTWKTYIFSHPRAKLNFYLDAGCQVLQSLDDIFLSIDKNGLFLVDQGQNFKMITPDTYKTIFWLDNSYDGLTTIHAGIIGFKNDLKLNEIFKKIYDSACAGLSLGFSLREKWRNKGTDKNIFTRDCEMFRHDLSLVNIILRKYYSDKIIINSANIYAGGPDFVPGQCIWQMRLNYSYLDNLNIKLLHKKSKALFLINRLVINFTILVKNINIFIKKKLGIIKL